MPQSPYILFSSITSLFIVQSNSVLKDELDESLVFVFCLYRKFNVINPTNTSYEFAWTEEESDIIQPFVCHTREGTIKAGMRYEVRH